MGYSLNQVFMAAYPADAATFCNANGFRMAEIEPQDGLRRFQIQEIPVPTPEEQAEMRRQEILAELDLIDRASSRSLRAILTAQAAGQDPDKADVEMLAEHEADAKALRAKLAKLNA